MAPYRHPSVNAIPLRLPPGADLRDALQAAHCAAGRQATFVMAGIGSLSHALVAERKDATID